MSEAGAEMERTSVEAVSVPVQQLLTAYKHEIQRIGELKKRKNAIVLAHSYQRREIVFGIADFVGDSLKLCMEAQKTDADMLVFCGVHFMAESAAILTGKKVVLPDMEARCSLMDGYYLPEGRSYPGIEPEDIARLKEEFTLPVLCYVNTSAAVKAESDVCCTSANYLRVSEKLGDRLIFIPDRNMTEEMGKVKNRIVLVKTNDCFERCTFEADKTVREKISPEGARKIAYSKRSVVGWNGRCMVHDTFTAGQAGHMRQLHPGIKILAHPECNEDVRRAADYVGGTGEAERYVEKCLSGDPSSRFMFITECGTPAYFQEKFGGRFRESAYPMRFLGSCTECPYMHKITLEKVLQSLENENPVVIVPEPICSRARSALERMMAYA